MIKSIDNLGWPKKRGRNSFDVSWWKVRGPISTKFCMVPSFVTSCKKNDIETGDWRKFGIAVLMLLTRFRPLRIDLQDLFFIECLHEVKRIIRCMTSLRKIRPVKLPPEIFLQIDSKWSETFKKHKTGDAKF